MNQEKAREFFSAYYDGTLERGLKQTLEQRLRADAQLTAEYRAFERTMEHLSQLKFEDIEVPIYLSDRIASRIEEARLAQKPRNPLMLWVPRFTIGGLAAVAVVFAVMSWFGRGQGPSTSGFGPGSIFGPSQTSQWPSETITVVTTPRTTTLHYQSATPREVKVLDEAGSDLKNFGLSAGQPLTTRLKNPNPSAALFEVEVSGSGPDEYIAVPGTKSAVPTSENGTVGNYVKALADRYSVPVILKCRDLNKTIDWNFSAGDAKGSAEKSLDSGEYDVTLTASRVLSISEK
jgi:hypothetical protein